MNCLNILNSVLDEKIDDEDYIVRDYLLEDNIDALITNINFFENIPEKDLYNVFTELITLIFEYQKDPYLYDFNKRKKKINIEVLNELREEEISKMEDKIKKESKNATKDKIRELINIKKKDINTYFDKEINKLEDKKPTIIIQEDLKTIKDFQKQIINFQQMAERLYGSKSKKTDEWHFLNIPKEIFDTYTKNKIIIQNNEKLIKDLENKEFKIISKYNYYEFKNPSKTPIKEYLINIRREYSLKNVSQIESDLIKGLTKDI